MTVPTLGRLEARPALDAPELLAAPVAEALRADVGLAAQVAVAPIDAELADTAAFCAAYDVGLEVSANCLVVQAKRGERTWYAACLVLATTRADVNNAVRRSLDVRKASFLAMDDAVERTGMEYGGITPVGLPGAWQLLVDARVAATETVIIGSGVRRSKLVLPGAAVAQLPRAVVVEGLGR